MLQITRDGRLLLGGVTGFYADVQFLNSGSVVTTLSANGDVAAGIPAGRLHTQGDIVTELGITSNGNITAPSQTISSQDMECTNLTASDADINGPLDVLGTTTCVAVTASGAVTGNSLSSTTGVSGAYLAITADAQVDGTLTCSDLNVTGTTTTISTQNTEIKDKTLTIGIADDSHQDEATARTNLAVSDIVMGQYTDGDGTKQRYGARVSYHAGADADGDHVAVDREMRVQGPLSFGSRDAAGANVRMQWFYRTGADKANASDKSTVELWRIRDETVSPLYQSPNRLITTFHDHAEP